MDYVNLTPHPVVFHRPACDGHEAMWKTLQPVGRTPARVKMKETPTDDTIWGMPVIEREPERLLNLPAPRKDTAYIVSSIMLELCIGRKDVFAPDTGATAIRTGRGRIMAVTRMVAAPTK